MNRFIRIIGTKKALWTMMGLLLLAPSLFSQTKSKKRGIAFGSHSEADMNAISKGINWWYNWGVSPESKVALVYQNYGMDFVPMTWNGGFNETALRTYYSTHPNAKYLLGFNEPNFTTQANMKPSVAAATWPRLEKIAKDFGLKIVSPAVNYADQPVTENGVTYTDPIAYLDAFFAACPNCQVDYIAMHNYMCYSSALTSDINRYKKYKKPIWLTEFACWDQPTITLDMQKKYLLDAIDLLEKDTTIFRYSWFTGRMSVRYPYLEMFSPTLGQMSELGQLYVNYNPVHNPNSYSPIPTRIEAEYYSAMSGTSVEGTKDLSGTVNVSSFDTGDWLEYNIEVPATDDYDLHFRVSANTATTIIVRESVILKTLSIEATGGFQSWITLKTTLNLTAGKHKIRLYTGKGQLTINWIEFTKLGQLPTSLSQVQQAQMRVYPNPVKDQLYIETQQSTGPTEVSILDLSGRLLSSKLFNGETSLLEIDFSEFANGSYIVRTKNSGMIFNQLILK